MRKGVLLFLILFWACSKIVPPEQQVVLARVGSKTISVNDFIKRSEYTIRPVWCKKDDYISKKIVLNSLIAEKLLAIEAGEDSVLLRNPQVENYLAGRKEQIMRRMYQYQHGQALVKPDSQFINQVALLAQRKYKVNILGADSKEKALEIKTYLNDPGSTLSKSLQSNDSLKSMEITFQSPLSDDVIKTLYFDYHSKGEIIGPLKLDGQRFIVLKIKGWMRHVVVSDQESRQLLNDVGKRIREIIGMDLYSRNIAELMHGKSVRFNKPVFKSVVNAIAPFYFQNEKERKEVFNKKLWNKDDSKMTLNDLNGLFDRLADETFFSFSGKKWSIADFEQAMQKHPLVFRNRKMPKSQFANQFKLAIVDMLRDKVITRQAYLEMLDKNPQVTREMNIWRDNLLALHQREKLVGEKTQASVKNYARIKSVIDPLLNTLRQKYSRQIFIDTQAFGKIKLTSIDMFALRQKEAFPVVVPEFPLLTTHNQLDYGRRMEENQ